MLQAYDELDRLPEPLRETLADRADRIRGHFRTALERIICAGRELRDAREELPHGLWTPWLSREFTLSEVTARKYIRVAGLVDRVLGEGAVIEGDVSALYDLTTEGVPEEAQIRALRIAQAGQFLTREIAASIVDGVVNAAKRAHFLEGASERLMMLAGDRDIDPDIIPVLIEMEKHYPSQFEEVVTTGAVELLGGVQVPLEQANARDVISFVEQVRFENRMTGALPLPDSDSSEVRVTVTMTAESAMFEYTLNGQMWQREVGLLDGEASGIVDLLVALGEGRVKEVVRLLESVDKQ